MGKGKNVILINGSKYRELIENASGKTLKEISLENGFSDSFLRMVVKTGKASPTAHAVAKLYGIEPSAYEVKPEVMPDTTGNVKQMSIEDLNLVNLPDEVKDAIKVLVMSAVIEALHEYFKDGAIVVTDKGATYKAPMPKSPTEYLKGLVDNSGKDKDDRFSI